MDRHYKVIFEALLSFLIIIEIMFLVLLSIGFAVGIKPDSIYSFGIWDLIICIIILFDFVFFRIIGNTVNKSEFIRENWVYIIASIPLFFISFNIFHLLDYKIIIGLIGILRLYALLKVLKITTQNVRKYPQKTKLDYATFVLLLVLIIGSLLFFLVERGVNPEVTSYESAIWYSLVSMTTTGYGDIVPITLIGQIIGVIMIFSGMGYVSLVTATLAFSFIEIFRKASNKASNKLGKTAERLESNLDSHDKKIDEVLKKMEQLEKKIDELEKSNNK
ncbi:MAG: ion transporter [Methanobacteriales archaeon HGW-Methanobacteriales-1]|jgi:voltage-gated potassium channel|nr:MAG: ion transporter [Methanobacteriales archaeon HGW-Methanobacteriales-1]